MSMIENLSENGGYVSNYVDKRDLVTALFHMYIPLVGGETK